MKKFWLPYSLWDIQGIELWLNELAAKGYELKKFSKFWYGRAEFQPSEEAKHCRYRLDPIGKDERELRERAANYRELGWRFVEQIGKLYAVYRCDDPEAPELYTRPGELWLGYEKAHPAAVAGGYGDPALGLLAAAGSAGSVDHRPRRAAHAPHPAK